VPMTAAPIASVDGRSILYHFFLEEKRDYNYFIIA